MKTFIKKEEYIFEIIHDLKAPVLSIDYALKNIKRDEFLDEIYKINKHNLNYIENMITGYSIEKGKYCPYLEEINLIGVIKEEIRVLEFLAREKKLKITLETKNIKSAYIKSDKRIIRQIILNLLTNAVKFTKNGGEIKICIESKRGYVKICFKNPKENALENICSTKIGLEIVKKKIKALRGKFKVEKSSDDICFITAFEEISPSIQNPVLN